MSIHPRMREIQAAFQLRFQNEKWLQEAFTHASFVNENRGQLERHNERLEFLGDAVLELCVSDELFRRFPKRSEGELTRMRAAIVCEPALLKYAQLLELGNYVLLGKGEELTGGRERASLLADLFEAFLGAMYLDQGIEMVKSFLQKWVFPHIEFQSVLQIDFKSHLQEFLQQQQKRVLMYRIVAENGPAHDREFCAEVYLDDECIGSGVGRSKKEAEQQAASKALQFLNVLPPPKD